MTRSCSVIASDRRSTPISTLSRASIEVGVGDRSRGRRARRTAPLRSPGSRGRRPRSPACRARSAADRRSGSSATFRAWMRRICSRPLTSGLPTVTCRSKRPGRSSAGSRMSGRLVAAIDDDALVAGEAVHLDEQLVQRLLALFVAERVAAAAAADGVELVDEDDAGLVAARVLEQLADARRRRRRRTSRRSPSRWRTGTARSLRRRSSARAASCRFREGRRAARPSGCGRRSAEKRSGSRRKSTISLTSSFASSTPATSWNVMTFSPCSAVRARPEFGMRPVVVR